MVSFLNALPLVEGLENLADVELDHAVPSRLIDALLAGRVDLALCSSIDYQRAADPLVIVPAGMIGGVGATLTVRLYAAAPVERLERVHCDTDSHTSVALMQIILRERYGRRPAVVGYDARRGGEAWPEAMLLIGDKVVTSAPPRERYPHQLDLGEAWSDLTATPFVFALWLARAEADPDRLRTAAAVLDRQRRRNRDRIETIVYRHAERRGWPRALAATYLHRSLVYDLDAASLAGLELFYRKAQELGLIDARRPIRLLEGSLLRGGAAEV